MRIAFVTNLYPPIQTGSAYWTREAAVTLAARGHHVIVITCAPGSSGPTVERLGEVKVYRLPTAFHFPALKIFLNFDQFYLLANRSNLRRVRGILRDERIEVIHQAGHLLDSILLSIWAKRNLHIPAICSIHTRIGHPTARLYDLLLRSVDRLVLGPLVMRRFERLVVLDEVLLQHYERAYSLSGITVLPVCVEDRILDEAAAEPSAEPPVRIVSVGHVTGMRDRRELLRAVAELKARGLAVRVEIVGKVLTSVTPRLIDELGLGTDVVLLGELPRDALLSVMRRSSLEMHWIDIPGVGLAAIEAMALGLAVAVWAPERIYGDVPLKHLENIVLIDPHDHASLVGTLERLVRDPALRRRIGANARELVKRHLTWSSVSATLEAVYAEAVAAARERRTANVVGGA